MLWTPPPPNLPPQGEELAPLPLPGGVGFLGEGDRGWKPLLRWGGKEIATVA